MPELRQEKKASFSQFIDLLLARLYDYEQSEGPGQFLDLREIAGEFRMPVPDQWIFDAAKVLESRGLVRAIFALGGYTAAMLTGEGRLFVEEEEGTGIIHEYRAAPANFVLVSGTQNQVVVGEQRDISLKKTIERERQPSFDLLDKIEKLLEEERSLLQADRDELLTDLTTVRTQLHKREPNVAVLAALLSPMSQIASIAGAVAQLVDLLNA